MPPKTALVSQTVVQFLWHLPVEKVAGILSPAKIWQWLLTYGLPILEAILPILLPLITKGKLTAGDVQWCEEAMHAEQSGKVTVGWITGALLAYLRDGTALPPVPASVPAVAA